MKSNGRIKLMTILFTIVARANCDFLLDSLSEIKISLQILQATVEKISSEQTKNNKKVDQLQRDLSKVDAEVKSLSLDINSMLGTNIETLEDLLVTNNKTFEALDQIQNEMETLNVEAKFKNACNEMENVTNSNDNLENDFNEESDKGKRKAMKEWRFFICFSLLK